MWSTVNLGLSIKWCPSNIWKIIFTLFFTRSSFIPNYGISFVFILKTFGILCTYEKFFYDIFLFHIWHFVLKSYILLLITIEIVCLRRGFNFFSTWGVPLFFWFLYLSFTRSLFYIHRLKRVFLYGQRLYSLFAYINF